MKIKNLTTIAGVALATATVTVMTFRSSTLEAGTEDEMRAANIEKPKLVSHGVEITLAAAGSRTFRAGDEPVFELKAVNTTEQAANVAIRVAMTASSPADSMSRVPRMPSTLWEQEHSFPLKPREVKLVTVPTRTTLPARSMVSVSLRESGPVTKTATVALASEPALLAAPSSPSAIVAINFSTAHPLAQVTASK